MLPDGTYDAKVTNIRERFKDNDESNDAYWQVTFDVDGNDGKGPAEVQTQLSFSPKADWKTVPALGNILGAPIGKVDSKTDMDRFIGCSCKLVLGQEVRNDILRNDVQQILKSNAPAVVGGHKAKAKLDF